MNKFILVLFVLATVLSINFVFAQPGIHEPGTGIADPELKEEGQGTGQGLQINFEQRLSEGEYLMMNGENLSVIQNMERLMLRVRNISAHSDLNITPVMDQNRTRLFANLGNNMSGEIKIMPDQAAEMALQRLRLMCNETNNCSMQLKMVGQNNQQRLAYELDVQKRVKVLGLFATKMQVQAQIDAENGNVISERKPWWSFLATEPAEA